jgi:hypothetical protein
MLTPKKPHKELQNIKEKLLNHPISNLTPSELQVYFSYRLDNLLDKKKILVGREMEYLFGETGKGSLRIDPEILSYLLMPEQVFLDNLITSLSGDPEFDEKIEKIKQKKIILQHDINKDIRSKDIKRRFVKLLDKYFADTQIITDEPLIVRATYNKIPVILLVKNGEWVLPNPELVNFLALAKLYETLPIIMGKKIHGILFPALKLISAIGTNCYRTYVSSKTLLSYEALNKESENPESLDDKYFKLKYNELLESINNEVKFITHTNGEGDVLKKFLENVLPNVAEDFYQDFLRRDINFEGSFVDVIQQLKNGKAKRGITKWLEEREALKKFLITTPRRGSFM